MATGVGMGFDLEGLDKAIKNAEKGFENLIKTGQRMEQALTQNFRNVAEQGVGAIVSKMDSVKGLLANLGKQKSGKLQIETSTAKAVENAVRFSELMSKINNEGASRRTNSAVYKINEELEAAKRRLAELKELLNFYAKGEGKSAIGFVDTSSTQQEARALMNRIDLLEREKASLQANARLRLEISQMRDNRQNAIDANYAEMVKRAAKESSEAAKAESRIYEERDAKREQAQREYDAMGRKMRQQTNLDLAREYELQEAQNKRNEASLKQQMEAQRKFAEERVKLEETLAAKTKKDEHIRLQKEWQEQLKARDAAEKSAIKAEEERYKQQEKQRLSNAVATSNNLDKIKEQQHRKELQRIDTENRLMLQAQKTKEKQNRQIEIQYANSTQGSLASYNQLYSPQGVRSLNQMKTVLKQLETAQANINRATKEGQRDWKLVGDAVKRLKGDIERTEREMGKFHRRQKDILDTSGQLTRAMAAVFSVSAIKGYINKLVEVRGEFELQQRSLQVLLQNKSEADALWDKTVTLAIKSPFTTKELVTATKQLAAYRIESEKLYETNKMLADVSIGLGVDMNRLILAFGQVKAANFLRGTELRQFTEAGVNMLDELAKRFSDIEGKAVSAAEVFDRISKRRVMFEDVEAVFKDITGEGGIFYQMQEKQSETLKGQILNLRDSYELLLNDIGKKNTGVIKDLISSMKSLIDNWETYAGIIKPILTFMITRFAIMKAQGVFRYMAVGLRLFKRRIQEASGGVNGFFAAIKKGMKTNWVGMLLALAATLYEVFNAFSSTTDAATDYAETLAQYQQETKKLVDDFKELVSVMNDSSKTVDEQNVAYKKLTNVYKDYLSAQDLERKNIVNLSNEQDKYIEKLERARKIREKEKMTLFVEDAFKIDTEALGDVFGIFEYFDKSFTKINAFKKIEELKEAVKSGSKTAKEAYEAFEEYLRSFNIPSVTTAEESALGVQTGGLKPAIDAFRKGNASLSDAVKGYFKAAANPIDAINYGGDIEELFKRLEQVNKEYAYVQDTSTESLKNFKKALGDITPTSLADLDTILKKIREEREKQSEFVWNDPNIANPFYQFSKSQYVDELSNLEKQYKDGLNKALIGIFDTVKEDNEKLINDLTESTFSGLLKGLDQSITEWTTEFKKTYDNAKDIIADVEKGGLLKSFLYSKEEINNARLVVAVYEAALGKDKNKDIEKQNTIFEKRLQVIKELHKAYKDLSKTLSDVEAKEGALAKYGNAFKEAFGKTVEEMGFDLYSENGLLSAIDYLIDNAPNVAKRIQAELAKGEITWETKIEVKQESDEAFSKDIENMFRDYELSLELEKLNIPKDLASRLFGIEDVELSDIRKRIEQEISNAQLKGGQEDFIAKRKEELEKVKDMEIKQQRELLKTYSKYLVQAQSERIKIKFDELRQLKEIESLEIGDADKELMRRGVQKAIQKRLDTQAWKDFQESGMYVRLFDNLEGASMHSLDKMENALMGLRDSLKDLDPSELKEINNQLEKIRDIKVDKNPFKGLANDAKTYFEYVKNRKDWEASLDTSEAKEADLRSRADEQSLYIKSLEDELDLIDQTTDAGIQQALTLESKIDFEKEYLRILLDELEAQGKITKEERARIEKGQNAGKSMQDRLNKTAQDISAVTSSMADMATNLEAAFGMSDSLKDTFELLQGIGGGVSDMFSGAANLFSGNPLQMIQGGMQVVGGVSKIFASFNEAHDKRIERKIEREIKLVERLGKLYEKLEKQIEAAYTIDTFQAASDAAKENIEEQIRATERMIEAEEDKKDTDHERIKEWQEQIEENLELLKELEVKRLQELGGIGGEDYYKDAAQSFAEAWLEAFYETGDGLTALEDEFDEVMKNLVKKQVLQRVAGALLQPLLTSIDTAVGNDGVFDEKEFAETMELAKQIFPDFNEKMKQTIEEMGMTDWAGKNAELGSLSAGIKGISESQADTIAAYLNSLRFYVADSNTQLKALVAAQGIDTDTPNPMLSQLMLVVNHTKTTADNTTAIKDMLDAMTTSAQRMGGRGIKVVMD